MKHVADSVNTGDARVNRKVGVEEGEDGCCGYLMNADVLNGLMDGIKEVAVVDHVLVLVDDLDDVAAVVGDELLHLTDLLLLVGLIHEVDINIHHVRDLPWLEPLLQHAERESLLLEELEVALLQGHLA